MVLAFNMGSDVQALLNNDVGQPMAQVFYQSFGQKGTLAVWSIVVVAQSVMTRLFSHNVTNDFTYNRNMMGSSMVSRVTQLLN